MEHEEHKGSQRTQRCVLRVFIVSFVLPEKNN